MKKKIQPCLIVLLLMSLFACNLARRVPKESYLLEKNTIQCDDKRIDVSELESLLKQKTNRKILIFPFYLGVYNWFYKENPSKLRKWIVETIGEPPIIWDAKLTQKNKTQFRIYLKDRGFYHAQVKDSLTYSNNKVKVLYLIRANTPYKIRNISYVNEKRTSLELDSIVAADRFNSLLKSEMLLDIDKLEAERERITSLLKEKGFYTFSKEFIYFRADTSLSNNEVDIAMGIKQRINNDSTHTNTDHLKYTINDIYIYPDYNPMEALRSQKKYFEQLDTILLDRYPNKKFMSNRVPMYVKPKNIIGSLLFAKDSLYKFSDIERSYKHLSSLSAYKLVNINFVERPSKIANQGKLDAYLQLTPATQQATSFDLEGSNSAANIGASANIGYKHKNVFRGSEMLDIKMHMALEANRDVVGSNNQKTFNTLEYGLETHLYVPRFLVFNLLKFEKQYAPKTVMAMTYNYQQRPDYTRIVRNASFGYYWQTSDYSTHLLNLIDFNSVRLPKMDSTFRRMIDTLYIRYSYQDHLFSAINYTYQYNDQNLKKKRDFIFLKFTPETAGNLLTLANEIAGNTKTGREGSYKFFKTTYAQYLKADLDFRYYRVLTATQKLVYRTFVGIGYPYGNTKMMPFGKQYSSGGANSLRAWQVRSLGPGTYVMPSNSYPNQSGDIKLESNIEYRGKISKLIEIAWFTDMGNIWAITKEDNREGVLFEADKFYKQIAVGSGVGLRFDLSFVIFRIDWGIKMCDPSKLEHDRWIWQKGNGINGGQFNWAIGYPF